MNELEQLEDLFTHPAWKQLAENMESILEVKQMTALDECLNEEQLHFRRGEIEQLRIFLSMPDDVRAELDGKHD